MAFLIEKDEQGRKLYQGFLSTEETKQADLLLGFLQDEIPRLSKELNEAYGDNALYKYYLGKRLGELLDEYDIQEKDRLYFWNEIKNFAPDKERKRAEGKNSKKRSFFEQCYQLSLIDVEIVKKFSWHKWQDLLDRGANREDPRLLTWIGQNDEKISESEWRSFEKALHAFLKNKDTSVFEDDELFSIYDMILTMAKTWGSRLKEFSKEFPKSAKVEKKSIWESKFYELCFKCRKATRKVLSDTECQLLFDRLMRPAGK